MLLRILLLGILTYLLYKVASLAIRLFRWQKHLVRKASSPSERQVNDLVRDPVCGMYISGDDALSIVQDGRRFHFCSKECRQAFISRQV